VAYLIKPLELGEIFDQAIVLFRNRFKTLVGISCFLAIPFELVQGLTILLLVPGELNPNSTPEEAQAYLLEVFLRIVPVSLLFAAIFLLFVWPVTNAAAIWAVANEYLGRPCTAFQAIRASLRMLGRVLVTGLISGILIFLGTMACLIPGIYLALRFWFVYHAVMIEQTSGTAALTRSGNLMKGHYGYAIVVAVLIFVINAAVNATAQVVPVPLVGLAVQVLANAVLVALTAAVGVVFYFSCRCRNENFDLALLANAVGRGSTA